MKGRILGFAVLSRLLFRCRSKCLVLLLAGCLSLSLGWGAETFYDLGGPCRDTADWPAARIFDAEKTGAWDRVVELDKERVRGGCDIEYRWLELATALLKANHPADALQALREIDSRGFDLNPSRIESRHQELKDFMETPLFKGSPVGVKFEQFKKLSNARRLRFREMLKAIPPNQRPPENYIARNACPFECCRFGDWTVLRETELVAAPGSKRVVGTAKKGSRAVALTGEVRLKPEPVAVLIGSGDLPRDSIAFILDYVGEGFGNVYTHGRIVTASVGYAEYCFRLPDSCWGETLLPANERKPPVWWVKVRLPNGVTGWTGKADNFGEKDGCG